MGWARETRDVRLYKDVGTHSDMQRCVSVQQCMACNVAMARSRHRQTTRTNQQWCLCWHAQECILAFLVRVLARTREHTIQYEQELESTQETLRNHAMQCCGRSLGGTMLGDDVEGGVEW